MLSWGLWDGDGRDFIATFQKLTRPMTHRPGGSGDGFRPLGSGMRERSLGWTTRVAVPAGRGSCERAHPELKQSTARVHRTTFTGTSTPRSAREHWLRWASQGIPTRSEMAERLKEIRDSSDALRDLSQSELMAEAGVVYKALAGSMASGSSTSDLSPAQIRTEFRTRTRIAAHRRGLAPSCRRFRWCSHLGQIPTICSLDRRLRSPLVCSKPSGTKRGRLHRRHTANRSERSHRAV